MFLSPDARYDSYAARARETQEESRLLSYLMENYDREVRPVYNASHPVEVKVGITLTQIFDMVSYELYENYTDIYSIMNVSNKHILNSQFWKIFVLAFLYQV